MSLEPIKNDPAVAGDVVRDVDPDAVARRIDAERAALGRTVEELAARLDWKAQLRRRVTQTTQGVGATATRLWQRLRRNT